MNSHIGRAGMRIAEISSLNEAKALLINLEWHDHLDAILKVFGDLQLRDTVIYTPTKSNKPDPRQVSLF